MGLLDNFKKSDEQIREETLAKYNIFEGIECEVTFPDTQLKIAHIVDLQRVLQH